MNVTDWIAIIGAVTGVVGTVLGVITIADLLSRNRVKLRVTPKLAWVNRRGMVLTAEKPAPAGHDPTGGDPPNRLAVEVVNLSAFAVTISEVGVGRVVGRRRVFVVPDLSDGKSWPVRLESREAVTAFLHLEAARDVISTSADRIAYSQTDCGVVKYGTSPMFDKFVDDLVRKGSEENS